MYDWQLYQNGEVVTDHTTDFTLPTVESRQNNYIGRMHDGDYWAGGLGPCEAAV